MFKMWTAYRVALRQHSTNPIIATQIGSTVSLLRKITKLDIDEFIKLSGDSNPIHLGDSQQKAVVHGAFLNSLVSCVIGTKLPGPGTLVVNQTLNFPNKCYVGETVLISVQLVEVRKIIKVSFKCEVEDGCKAKTVLFGDAKLIIDKSKIINV